jgi:small nuclear ribonucleoprotein (snRNP)-like protein
VRIILNDGRILVGKLYATDKFFNVVLAETEEVRTLKGKKGIQLLLYSIILFFSRI